MATTTALTALSLRVPSRMTMVPVAASLHRNVAKMHVQEQNVRGIAAAGNHVQETVQNLAKIDIDDPSEWYEVPVHTVTVVDRQRGVTHRFPVPQDQYILHTAEDQQISLPFSCRHGCCTACAVRVKSGQLYQPEALGISAELKAKGYGLLCVGFPLSDIEVETQDEDEVYWLQFGQYFARGPLERDDYALELAMADE
ncbi:unnamed protein product [Sphagnum compactum]